MTAVALLLPALGLAGCGRRPAAAPAPAPVPARAIAVRAVAAAPRTFERRLTVQGTLVARTFANVAARVEGNLDAVWVDEGDPVVAGETALFQVDPAGRRNAVTIAEQNLAVAGASLAVARASAERAGAEARKAELDFERFARLRRGEQATAGEYETAEVARARAAAGLAVAAAQVDLAERQAKQAEASLSIARKNLDDTKTIAPISGAVSARRAEPGEQMSVGRVVLRIDDLSSIDAAAFLPAQYYPDVTPGQTAFRLDIAGRDAGTHVVTYRSPTIDPALRTFEIKGAVGAAGGAAVPGQMANLTLVFASRTALGVPSASVLLRAGKPVVFVARDGRAVLREVETGLQNDGWTEIRSGLDAGDPVVTEGQTQLHDGMPLQAL